MLVLTRMKDEKIVIAVGDLEVIVTVAEIRGDTVRLGFDAPREITIDRLEVYEAKQQQAAMTQTLQHRPNNN